LGGTKLDGPQTTLNITIAAAAMICVHRIASSHVYSFCVRKRSAFAITDSELKDIASAAIIGLSNSPNAG
jgi:hypothetical protein